MKILAIGDFHGKFPKKLQNLTKQVDLIISVGDYFPGYSGDNFLIRDVQSIIRLLLGELDEKHIKKEIEQVRKILKKLNSSKAQIVTTFGNYDNHASEDTSDRTNIDKNIFSEIIKDYPNLRRVDYRAVKIGELTIIGAYGSSFPGDPESNSYKKSKKKLKALFKKHSVENREGKVIFIAHNMPYNCKLDKIRDKKAHPIVRGEHYGSKLIREIIDRYQPSIFIGGHMHENHGMCKIKKTLVIDAGPAIDGKATIIDFDENAGKVNKIKFIK
ncbi:MAG: metallophosphoesterase [archaeon]|nr:metallophosphoesterase [archaeon]MCR4323926.1 metallophosphoesterase [Nanoarchaeota archaeon]